MSGYLSYPSLAKNAIIAAMSLITLSTGIYFAVKANINCASCNGATVQVWQTQSGSTINQKALLNSSGSLAMSGSAAIGRNSGTTGSGAINNYFKKACNQDFVSGGWTLCVYKTGSQTCRVATASECPAR